MIGGLAVLADRGVFPWWPVLLIAAREFGISLYRSIAGRRGIVLPAQRLGKYKAFTQYCAVGFVLLPITADYLGLQQAALALGRRAHAGVRAADRAPRLHRLAASGSLSGARLHSGHGRTPGDVDWLHAARRPAQEERALDRAEELDGELTRA